MQFTGRLTNNAVVKTTKDERQVVSFSVAINDQYKRKGNDMPIKTVLYINCSYWVNTSIALHLTKGSIVELQGRLSLDAYTIGDEAKATLNAHINVIKIHSSKKGSEASDVATTPTAATITEPIADLPF